MMGGGGSQNWAFFVNEPVYESLIVLLGWGSLTILVPILD